MRSNWSHHSKGAVRPWTSRDPVENGNEEASRRVMTARPSTPERGGRPAIRYLSTAVSSGTNMNNNSSYSNYGRNSSPPRPVTALNTISQLESTRLPLLNDGDVVMRRYSFETGVVNPLPYTQHFDIFVGKENAIEHRTDYLRVYYTDFLTHNPKPLFEVPESRVVDAKTLREWIVAATPRTRIDAYPMLLLLKDLLVKLMNQELELIDSDLDKLKKEKVELLAEIDRLRHDLAERIRTSDATISHLTEENTDFKEKIAELHKQHKALVEENKDLKKQLQESNLKLKQTDGELQRAQAANKQLQQIKSEHMKNQATINQLQARLQVALESGKSSASAADIALMSAEGKAEILRKLLEERPSVLATYGVQNLVNQLPEPLDLSVLKILLTKFADAKSKEWLAFTSDLLGKDAAELLAAMMEEHLSSGADPEDLISKLHNNRTADRLWALAKSIITPTCNDHNGPALLRVLSQLLGHEESDEFMERLGVRHNSHGVEEETQTEEMQPEAEEIAEEPTPVSEVEVAKPKKSRKGTRTGDKIFKLSNEKPMTIPNMQKVIAQILEEKVIADEVDDRENNSRQTMAEFTKDFFSRTYGLKSLALKNLAQLGSGIRKFSETNLRLKLFGVIAGIIPVEEEIYAEDSGNLLCDCLGQLFPKSSISERLSKDNPKAPLEALQEATMAGVRAARTGAGIGSVDKIMDKCKELSQDGASLDVDSWLQVLLLEWTRYTAAGEPDIIKLFYQMDDNASGILSEAEFVEGTLRLVPGVSEDAAVELFSSFSIDRGGVKVLNEEAFAALLRANRDFATTAGVEIIDEPILE